MATATSVIFLVIVIAFSTSFVDSTGNPLRIEISKNNGEFKLFVANNLWFSSAGAHAHNNKKWYTSLDKDTLQLAQVTSDTVKEEDWGSAEITNFTWTNDNEGFGFTSSIKVYKDVPVIVFGQRWDMGGVKTACGADSGSISYWPTFKPEYLNNMGYMTYSGNFAAFMKFGVFDSTSSVYSNIDGGFPMAVFDKEMKNSLIISPLNTFMSSSLSVFPFSPVNNTPTFGIGIVPNVESVPKDYVIETIVVGGPSVTETMAEWGQLLRSKYKKTDKYRIMDPSINYLGYYTDNGACYYYNTGEYKSYEDAVIAVKKASIDNDIPYRYLQLDSWWYYKGEAGGVKNWTAMPGIFPHGMHYVSNVTGWKISAHNRYWSNNTDYARQNGGKFDFILDSNGYALPNDPAFWKYLLSTSKNDWNLMVYEQDWLDKEYESVSELQSVLNLGEMWLNSMGEAAMEVGVTIQYCMPWTRHILQSLSNSVVTQIRVSDDYQPGNGQWQVGDTTMLAHAVGLASFKDTFRTIKMESNCKFMTPEPYPELETFVAALTGGPVGPSDTASSFNRTLIMSTCMADGLLLKPTRPAISLDSTFVYRAFGSGGPDGAVTIAYTEVSSLTWYYVLAANISKTYYGFKASQLPPSESVKPKSYLPPYIGISTRLGHSTEVLDLMNHNDVIPIPSCGKDDFQYWILAPFLSRINAAIFGELDKVISISEQRFSTMTGNGDKYALDVNGAKGETITLSTYSVNQENKPVIIRETCYFSAAGTKQVIIGKGGTITC